MVDKSNTDHDETREEYDPHAETHASETAGKDWLDTNVGVRGDEWIGRTIGQFEIIRIIGTGGMGNVYEAKQSHPQRVVALKIVKSVAANPATLHRFEMESETLARLQHPSIAQVYDSGHQVYEGSLLPYFAMEFVSGSKSITDYAEDEHLSRRGRLELLLRVCDAVQYGHGRGVIHRDLKPSNILITHSGRPKVIDFGVALMVGTDESEKTITATGRFVGTLQWSSPEQCGDDPHDVDVRTDVYSLGMVMYQLMVGELPYVLKGVPLYRAPLVVRETKPIPPRTVDPMLPPEIEQILLKALEKERESRYESIAEFAMDIRRFLADQPIHAKSPTTIRRLRLYARRNQLKFRAAIVVFLAIMLGLTGLIWGFIESETRQRQIKKALIEEGLARQIAEQKAYIAGIGTVQAAIANGSWDMARHHLAATNRDRRGWEWHYLQGVVDQSLRTWLIGYRPLSLASSPSGSHFAVAFEGGRVILIDKDRDVFRDIALSSRVRSMEFSVEGSLLLLGMANGQIAILNLTRDTLTFFDETFASVESISAIGEGSFATGHADGSVRVWTTGGDLIRVIEGDSGMVLSLAFNRDTKLLAIGSVDGTVQVWKMGSEKPLMKIRGHGGSVHAVAFLDDGTLVSGAEDDTINLWDLEQKQIIATHDANHGGILDLAVSNNTIASVGMNGVVQLWTTDPLEPVDALRGHDDVIWSVDVLSDNRFVSIGRDGSIRWWSDSVLMQTTLNVASEMLASDIAFVWNDTLVSVSEFDSDVQVIDVTTGHSSSIASEVDHELSTVEFVPTTSLVVTGDVEGDVRVWDIDSLQLTRFLGTCQGQISTLTVPQLGKFAAAGTFNGHICVWNIRSGESLFNKKFSDAIVLAMAFDSKGEVLFVSTGDGVVTAINMATGENVWSRIGNERDAIDLVHVPSKNAILTATTSNVIQLINESTGEILKSLETTGSSLRDVAIFPDGTRFATALANGTVGIFDLDNFSLIASFPTIDSLECIDVSSDSYRLAIGGGNATIQVMDGMTRSARRINMSQ